MVWTRRFSRYLQANYPGLWIARINLLLTLAMIWWVAAGLWTLMCIPRTLPSGDADLSNLADLDQMHTWFLLIGAALSLLWLVLICLRPRWHHVLGRWADLKYVFLIGGVALLMSPAPILTRLLADIYSRLDHQFIRDLAGKDEYRGLARRTLLRVAHKNLTDAFSAWKSIDNALEIGEPLEKRPVDRTWTSDQIISRHLLSREALSIVVQDPRWDYASVFLGKQNPNSYWRHEALLKSDRFLAVIDKKEEWSEPTTEERIDALTTVGGGRSGGEMITVFTYDRLAIASGEALLRVLHTDNPFRRLRSSFEQVRNSLVAMCGHDCAQNATEAIMALVQREAELVRLLREELARLAVDLPSGSIERNDDASKARFLIDFYIAWKALTVRDRAALLERIATPLDSIIGFNRQLQHERAILLQSVAQLVRLIQAHSSDTEAIDVKRMPRGLDNFNEPAFRSNTLNYTYLFIGLAACLVIALYRQTNWADVCLLTLGGSMAVAGLLTVGALNEVITAQTAKYVLHASINTTSAAEIAQTRASERSAASVPVASESSVARRRIETTEIACLHVSPRRAVFGLVWLIGNGFPIVIAVVLGITAWQSARISRRMRLLFMSMCLAAPLSLALLAVSHTPFCGMDERVFQGADPPTETIHAISLADYVGWTLKGTAIATWMTSMFGDLQFQYGIWLFYMLFLLLWDLFWRQARKLYLLPQ